MIDRFEFHPSLRSRDDHWLYTRSSWFSFFYPAEDRILWRGDVRLYCRDEDYQHVLDSVPCLTEGEGLDRRCALRKAPLDEYRIEVAQWLAKFDEQGRLHVDA